MRGNTVFGIYLQRLDNAPVWELTGEFKILILGLDNAGKTTLLYKISSGDDVHTVPTIGYNAEEMRWKNFRLVLWDIGGQNELRPAWNTYFSSTSVSIF